jgi:hypothetical protein
MSTLVKSLRNQPERTVEAARDDSETVVCGSLEKLGIGDANPPSYLREIERDLHRRLRILGWQGEGLLRDNPIIHSNKRPAQRRRIRRWYHVFDGERINEHDPAMAVQRTAMEAAK